MKKNTQLSLLGEHIQSVNECDLEIKELEVLIERLHLARICVGHKQSDRAVNNLLLVRKDLNKLIKRLKK